MQYVIVGINKVPGKGPTATPRNLVANERCECDDALKIGDMEFRRGFLVQRYSCNTHQVMIMQKFL